MECAQPEPALGNILYENHMRGHRQETYHLLCSRAAIALLRDLVGGRRRWFRPQGSPGDLVAPARDWGKLTLTDASTKPWQRALQLL
jgi:hypothetical protein